MHTWPAIFAAFFIALAVTPLAIRLALRFHIVDIPNHRKVHSKPTPRIGGLAIYAGFVVGTLLLAEYTRQVAAVLVAGSVVFFTGLIDDI